MSSVPGGSGENIVYALLCGGAFVGAVSYVSHFAFNTGSHLEHERDVNQNHRVGLLI